MLNSGHLTTVSNAFFLHGTLQLFETVLLTYAFKVVTLLPE